MSNPTTTQVENTRFPSRTIGLISAALVALSPYAIWYAQEARMYALLLCAASYAVLVWPVVERYPAPLG